MSPKELEYIPCEICAVEAAALVFLAQGDRLVRCQRCGLVYVNPRPVPDSRREFYGHDYFQKGVFAPPGRQAVEETAWDRQRIRFLSNSGRRGRLLDIGCGTGRFLTTAQQDGWEVVGIEYSPYAADVARQATQAEVHAGALVENLFPAGTFDAASLLHVLEHVPHPRQTLRLIHGLLRPQGRLLIEVPDFGCPRARKFREQWINIKPQEHLFYFTQRTLAALLRLENFRVLTVRRAGGLGVLAAGKRSPQPAAWAHPIYEVRRWLGATPSLRNLLRYLYWDVLRQHDNLLVVAEKGK